MFKQISSLQNSLVKQVLHLQEKSRERKKQGLFIIEGLREITLALKGGYIIETILFCSEIVSEENIENQFQDVSEVIEITHEVYKKIAYRNSTEGIIAIAKSKDLQIKNLKAPFDSKDSNLLILVAEALEKPGNIGALLRTADAANIDAVLIANPKTDMYNPNIIRSSVGCLFTNTIATGTSEEIILFLKNNNVKIYCAELQASNSYLDCNFNKASAIILGAEANGLSNLWLENSTQNIIIPMQGEIDSMNVSVAAGIIIFEAKRQRLTIDNCQK